MTRFIVAFSPPRQGHPGTLQKEALLGAPHAVRAVTSHQSLVTGWVSRSEHNANGRVLRRILCYAIHVGWGCMPSSNLDSLCRFPPARRVPAAELGLIRLAPHSKRAPRHAATVTHKAITRHVYMFEVSPGVCSGKGTKERNQAVIFLMRGKVDKALGNPYVCPVEQGSSQDLAL